MHSRSYHLATFFLIVVALTYILASLFLLARADCLYSFAFPIAVGVGGAWITIYSRKKSIKEGKSCKKSSVTLFYAASLLIGSLLIAAMIADNSWDGNMYHQEIAASLADGWNPFDIGQINSDHSVWANHYAIAFEMTAGAILSTLGNIECGKAVNLMLAISAFFYALDFCRLSAPDKSRKSAIAISIATVANPVVTAQLFSFYIDFTKYLYFLIALILLYRIKRESDSSKIAFTDLMAYASIIVLCIGTKFNIFAEAMLLLLLTAIWLAVIKDFRTFRIVGITSVLAIIAGLIINIHPYWHNYLLHSHPLYPLMGPDAYEIMDHNTPEIYGNGRVWDFILSMWNIEIPNYDSRAGGFGPLMLPILIISLIVIALNRKAMPKTLIYIAACALLSCFIFEQSWWARYIAQLWLLSSIALYVVWRNGRKIWMSLLWVLMIADTLPGAARTFASGVQLSLYRNQLYEVIPGDSVRLLNYYPQFAYHLKRQGIVAIPIAEPDVDSTKQYVCFYGTADAIPQVFPLIEVDNATLDSLRYRVEKIKIYNRPYHVSPSQIAAPQAVD